jgi:small conductance mechanosensitive channel
MGTQTIPTRQTQQLSNDASGSIFSSMLEKTPMFIGALIIAILSYALAGVAKRAIMRSLSEHNTDDQIAILVGRATYGGVLVIGFTIALKMIGIDITSIVGLFGLGFSFAMQDVIKNFVAGALLVVQKPFRIGDVIKVNEFFGKVESIDSRSTNIKTFDGQRVIIPNADMFSHSVTNYSTHNERRVTFDVGVGYETNLAEAAQIVMNTLYAHDDILKNPVPKVTFESFDDSSILLRSRYWISSNSSLLEIKSIVLQEIKWSFDQAGINIPFPIRSLDINSDQLAQSFAHHHINTKQDATNQQPVFGHSPEVVRELEEVM